MNTPAGDQSPFFDRPEFFDKLAVARPARG